MSVYVVTETGVVIEYQDGHKISWTNETNVYAKILNVNDHPIGFVPRGAVVSFRKPWVMQQAPNAKERTIENSLKLVTECIRSLTGWRHRDNLRNLKRELADYDARSGVWK